MAGSSASAALDRLAFGMNIYYKNAVGGAVAGAEKRRRKPASMAPAPAPAKCQVEGCSVDLSGGKAYYRRHKVCAVHSKTPLVVVGGVEQRFCQQCSRFHLLAEFDQGKRSCRRRLAGHNARRRKPSRIPFSSRSGRLTAFRGDHGRFTSFLLDFSHPRVPADSRDHLWPTPRAGDPLFDSQQWKGHSHHGVSSYAQAPTTAALPTATGHLPGEVLAGVGGSHSSRALSLLSTEQWTASAAEQTPAAYDCNSRVLFIPGCCPGTALCSLNQGRSFSPHLSHPMRRADHGRFSGDLDLLLQRNRLQIDQVSASMFDQSGGGRGMNWSL